MSEDAIDYAYEEQLKAEEGYLELWIRFATGENKRVRTFPNTAAWRVAVDRLAIELVGDPDVVKCWTVPMEASATASVDRDSVSIEGRGGAGERPDGSPGVAPARTAPPSPSCCEPVRHVGPSGVRLRHAWTCRYRGEPYVAQVEMPPRLLERNVNSARRLSRIHRSETRRIGLDEPELDRSVDAGGVLASPISADAGCPAHPREPLYTCPVCSERRTS